VGPGWTGVRTEHGIVGGPLSGQFALGEWVKRYSVFTIDVPVIDKVVGLGEGDLAGKYREGRYDGPELLVLVCASR
jgi:hypothetical protein